MKYYSLRRRAMAALLVPLFTAVIVIIILATFFSYGRISEMRNAEMLQDGAVLALLLKHEALEGDQIGDVKAHNVPSRLMNGRVQFRILSRNGLVGSSGEMPSVNTWIHAGFSEIKSKGQRWQVLRMTGGPNIWIDVAEPLSLRRSLTYSIVLSLAFPLLVMAASIAMIVSIRVQSALAPLERLSADLERLDAGDISPLEEYDAPEEVRSLIDALNTMLGRLQTALTQEREFSDNAAHELRTPLAVLKLRAQLMERRLGDDPALKRDMNEFFVALDRATDVIDRMLEIARLSSETEPLHAFDLSASLLSVVSGFNSAADAKDIQLTFAMEPDIVVHGSKGALESAAYNIIENAVKFVPEGGRIHASLTRGGGMARFAVTDNGPGIRPGEEELIFTRFWRADKNSAGTGLGLALVRRVALLHGGQTGALPTVDSGLTVFFEIPLSIAFANSDKADP